MAQPSQSAGWRGDHFEEDTAEQCIHRLIGARAERTPDALAILAPGRKPLTYSRLLSQIEYTVGALNDLGLGRDDRIAIVLPNGPEMAVAFVAVAAGATAAPLNPAYRANEFDFFLSDLKAKAIIVNSAIDPVVSAVARSRGIRIIELSTPAGAEAGVFALQGAGGQPPKMAGYAQPADVALALHTSGTTSRPKLGPLTQRNVYFSALSIRSSLELDQSDRCLNVMPLFHVHGLMASLLASLAAGANVVCASGFYAPKFFDWMEEFRPTWYTAVPTIHQAILARADASRDIIARCPLRFIRSCSAPLPPAVMSELETTFGVPVIEAYGMTEASHQMASNPLPPRQRKPGSVGVAAGADVAIVDQSGHLLPADDIGEIVVRGQNVMRRYENNPEANRESFVDGWFRTGDLGSLDADGFLYIKGRIKEIINRGGEKISPREIDEALLEHPAIAQAVAFAIPHDRLGEDVAAAVVLRDGVLPAEGPSEREIREFVASRLADFKVPARVLVLGQLPLGPTGKPQRVGLAERLGLATAISPRSGPIQPFAPPTTELERLLADIWAEVLGIPQVGVNDNFLELGGDSILATRVVSRVRQALEVELSLIQFFENPTVASLAAIVEDLVIDQIEGLDEDEVQSLLR